MDILLGLPYLSNVCAIHRLILYILIIFSLDIIAGALVTFQTNISRTFTLPRMGYLRWWMRVVKCCAVVSCFYTLVMSIFALIVVERSVVLAAGILFFLNSLLLTLAQSCLLIATGNSTAVFSAMAVLNLVSIFLSQHLPIIGKWLPRNWGMLIRSELQDQAGFPIGIILTIEVILIAVMIWIGPWIVKKAV